MNKNALKKRRRRCFLDHFFIGFNSKIAVLPCRLTLIIILLFSCGCGGSNFDQSPALSVSPVEESLSISRISIAIENNLTEINRTVQLFASVTLSNGEIIYGLTTEFTDPDKGIERPIQWSSSDSRIAIIDEYARIIPLSQGYVEVGADIGGRSASKILFINRSDGNFASEEEDDVSSPDDESIPDAPERSCQGHAVGVVSFVPGAGAGFGSSALPGIVLGPPQGRGELAGSTHVVSLGRGGEIILDLGSCHLTDGPGTDLIVFENPFFIGGDPANPYAELGSVGVSGDGMSFTEFACSSGSYPYTGCAGWHPVYSSTSNDISPFDVDRAGGDNFDLAEIGVESARYIRVRDVGSVGFGTSIGFDLDAVSVINGIIAD
jgi:hypothetical protein